MPATKSAPDDQVRDAFDHADEVLTVASEAVDRMAYDSLTETLFVTFVKGKTYFYADVPPTVWEAFKAADSKGTFFRREILNQYDFGEM